MGRYPVSRSRASAGGRHQRQQQQAQQGSGRVKSTIFHTDLAGNQILRLAACVSFN